MNNSNNALHKTRTPPLTSAGLNDGISDSTFNDAEHKTVALSNVFELITPVGTIQAC